MLAAALREEGIAVVAEATSGQEAVELTRFYHPDVVLVGTASPASTTVEAVRAMLQAEPGDAVVIVDGDPDDEEALKAVREGASGYLSKDLDPGELCRGSSAASPTARRRSRAGSR